MVRRPLWIPAAALAAFILIICGSFSENEKVPSYKYRNLRLPVTVRTRGPGCPTRVQGGYLSAKARPSQAGLGGKGGGVVLREKFSPVVVKRSLPRTVVVRDGLFGVGPLEVITTLAIASVLIGPQGIVQAIRQVAKLVKELQPTIRELASQSSELTETINRELGLDEITETINSAQREIRSVQDELTTTIRDASVPPPPPPPPLPSLSKDDTDTATNKTQTLNEAVKDEFIPPSDEEIEDLKKANFWSPRDEAEAEETDKSSTKDSKPDGGAVWAKAMKLAEEKQRREAEAQAIGVGVIGASMGEGEASGESKADKIAAMEQSLGWKPPEGMVRLTLSARQFELIKVAEERESGMSSIQHSVKADLPDGYMQVDLTPRQVEILAAAEEAENALRGGNTGKASEAKIEPQNVEEPKAGSKTDMEEKSKKSVEVSEDSPKSLKKSLGPSEVRDSTIA